MFISLFAYLLSFYFQQERGMIRWIWGKVIWQTIEKDGETK